MHKHLHRKKATHPGRSKLLLHGHDEVRLIVLTDGEELHKAVSKFVGSELLSVFVRLGPVLLFVRMEHNVGLQERGSVVHSQGGRESYRTVKANSNILR